MTLDLDQIVATATDLPCQPIAVDDALEGLGFFRTTWTVTFGLPYPTGWTNCTWSEQNGCSIAGICFCRDCRAVQYGIEYVQRLPDDIITCDTIRTYDQWDRAISPRYCHPGCTVEFFPSRVCAPAHGGIGKVMGRCGATDDRPFPGTDSSNCWPLVPFATAAPSLSLQVVADASGPPCLEDEPATRLRFSGQGFEGMTFLGATGGMDAARCGLDSCATRGFAGGTDVRSCTAWDLENDVCWRVRFWAKADDADAIGYKMAIRCGIWPYFGPGPKVDTGPDMDPGGTTLTLTDDWLEFDLSFQWWSAPVPAIPGSPLTIWTTTSNPDKLVCGSQILNQAKGSALIKAVTVTPCFPSGGAIIDEAIASD